MFPREKSVLPRGNNRLMIGYLLKYRFFILCLIIFGLMVFQTMNGQWAGDFWEHSAVVRELATHPFSPKHPLFLLDAPHSFYSPYSLGVALISRTTGLGTVTALSVVGIANLAFFLFSLKLFVSSLFPVNKEATSFYSLLFVLFLWGISQWRWSGFFNLLSLSYTLPYPSTFAASLAFMALAMWVWLVKSSNILWLIPITGASCVILLTHPLSYIFLAVGMVAITVAEQTRFPFALWLMLVVFAVSLLAAAAWPYYPFFRMILSDPIYSNYLKADSAGLYQAVPVRILPALAGVPVIIWRMKANWRDPLGLMFVMLVAVYAFGAIFEQWTYGRVISPIVLTLQIALAAAIARWESKLNYKRLSPVFQRGVYCLIIVLFCLACSGKYLLHAIHRCIPGSPSVQSQYAFLSKVIPQYDVVLADFDTDWVIPTFGGKVVATHHVLAFVPDQAQRRKDVNAFFSTKSDYKERLAIVRRYDCRHILISKENPASQEIVRSFLPSASIEYEDNKYILLSLAPDHNRPDSSGIRSFDCADARPA